MAKRTEAVLQIFRTNQPLVLLLVILMAAVLRASGLLLPSQPDYQAGYFLSEFVFDLIGTNNILAWSLALLLVVFQSVYINAFMNNYRMMREINYMPGAIYAVLVSSIPDFIYLSPVLMAQTFVIIAAEQIFNIYRKPDASKSIYNIGFWLGVAGLFYYPAVFLFLGGFIGLSTMRAFRLNEYVIMIVGFCTPVYLGMVAYFVITGHLYTLDPEGIRGQFAIFGFLDLSAGRWIQLTGFVIYIFWALFSMQIHFSKNNISVQKILNVCMWFLLLIVFTFIYKPGYGFEHLLFLGMPLVVLITYSFLSMQRRDISEGIFLGMILFALINQYQDVIIFQFME